MPRGTELNAYKRDNCLVDFIMRHKGEASAVSGKEIAKHLNESGFYTKKDDVHSMVNKVKMERHLPICSARHSGYFWATNSNEIRQNIEILQKRVDGMLRHIDHLKSFIID